MSNILEKDRVTSYAEGSALNPKYKLEMIGQTLYMGAKLCIIYKRNRKKKHPNRWQPLLRRLYMQALKTYREFAEDSQGAARQIWVQRMNDLFALMPKHMHVKACACFCVLNAIRNGVEGLILPAPLQAANDRLIRK